jgi:multicomponent Na+:H+ antiporter subunit D
MSWAAPLPCVIPIVAGAFLAAFGTWLPKRTKDVVGIAAAAASAVFAVLLMHHALGGYVVHWFGDWQPKRGVAIGIAFAVDPLGAGAAALAAVLTVAAFAFSWSYFDAAKHYFHVLLLVFLGAMCGFALSGDLFNMFVFFELMSVAAYALTGYLSEEHGPIQGALNFGVTNSVGAFLILIGTGLLYGETGALNLAQLGNALAGRPVDSLVIVAFTLLVCGFLVKAAAVPFHFWLADAHAVAPAPVCVLFSGMMVELGLLGVARVDSTIFSGALHADQDAVRSVLVGLGVATALVGGVMALLQRHLKRLLAYSTISHSGLFLAGIALLTPKALAGTASYVLAHGLLKGALFLAAGILLAELESVDELKLRGRGRALRATAVVFAAAGIGLAGPPFIGTFLGKSDIEDAGTHLGLGWLPLAMTVASVLSTAAILRAGGRIFAGWGPARDETLTPLPDEKPAGDFGHARRWHLVAPAAVLAAAGLAVSLVPGIAEGSERAADLFRDRHAYVGAVLEGHRVPAPPAPPHEVTAASLAWATAGTLGALALAAALLFARRRPERIVARPVVLALRGIHGGHVGHYVTWLVGGAAGLGALFALLL